MTHGGINKSTGELICTKCISHTEIQIRNISILNKLINLHLDELDELSVEKKDILDSIQLLNIFLSYHIEGLKKVKSMEIVRSILDKEEF